MKPSDEQDTQKLHDEVLQLRNQQFYLGTLALAGSGLTALVAPAASAITQGTIPETALVGGAVSWLVLLALLFLWSLALRRLITIISHYLELRGLSRWEPDFRALYHSKKGVFPSQSHFVAVAFTIYGVLVVSSCILAALSVPDRIYLGRVGYSILAGCLLAYLLIVWICHARRIKKDPEIVRLWRERIASTADA
jgi:hypothetical protein